MMLKAHGTKAASQQTFMAEMHQQYTAHAAEDCRWNLILQLP
jgi:hypothetical protein